MQATLFQSALGITAPWYVKDVDSDVNRQVLTIHIDFARGSRTRAEPTNIHPPCAANRSPCL